MNDEEKEYSDARIASCADLHFHQRASQKTQEIFLNLSNTRKWS